MHKTKTKPETKPNFSLSLNLCVCVYTTTTKQKKNLLIRKHKLNYWMSSALAAQMYAAQLSSQQQQNMYVKSSSCSKTNSKNKPNIFPKSAPENCPFLESANIGIVKMLNWTMFFFCLITCAKLMKPNEEIIGYFQFTSFNSAMNLKIGSFKHLFLTKFHTSNFFS